MNRIKCHVKKGDQVEVISGNFRGSSGKILAVFQGKQRVVVEGVRIIKKHLRKSEDNPQGKIAEREGPIHISNVKLIEPGKKAEKKTKAKSKKETEKKEADRKFEEQHRQFERFRSALAGDWRLRFDEGVKKALTDLAAQRSRHQYTL